MDYNIINTNKTIEQIITEKKNYIRLGDGEFRILCGHRCSTPFQSLNNKLKEELYQIITEVNQNIYTNLIIGINITQFKKEWFNEYFKKNIKTYNIHETIKLKKHLPKLIKNKNITYVSSYIDDIENNIVDMHIELNDILFTDILKHKDTNNIDIIKCKSYLHVNNYNINSINNMKNNIYEKYKNKKYKTKYSSINAECGAFVSAIKLIKMRTKIEYFFKKSKTNKVNYIKTYFKENYEQYDYILQSCINLVNNTDIFIFGCGPVGKIIIFNLIKRNINKQFVDLGQII